MKNQELIYFFRRGDGRINNEVNMRFMEEWFQHEEERRTIVFKTVVGRKIIPFSPAHDGYDRKKCA